MIAAGVINVMYSLLNAHLDLPDLQANGIGCFVNLARYNDAAAVLTVLVIVVISPIAYDYPFYYSRQQVAIVNAGGIARILAAMKEHPGEEILLQNACGALSNLTFAPANKVCCYLCLKNTSSFE